MLIVWINYSRNRDTGTTARHPGTGWHWSACSDENVDNVWLNDLVLSQKAAPKRHQITCQIARETCIHHSSVYIIIYQDLLLKYQKWHVHELTGKLWTLVRLAVVLQGRIGTHKIGVVWNTINVFFFKFSQACYCQNYENWFTINKVIGMIKRV